MGRYLFTVEVYHPGLNKRKSFNGNNRRFLDQQAAAQKRIWDDEWTRKQDQEAARKFRDQQRQLANQKKENADEKIGRAAQETQESIEKFNELQTILQATLAINDAIDWDTLKDKSHFPERVPPTKPLGPIPPAPNEGDPKYQVKQGLMDSVFGTKKRQKEDEANRRFEQDLKAWRILQETINIQNRDIEKINQGNLALWERRRKAFESEQKQFNQVIDERRTAYERKDLDAILDYCQLVLSNSRYPDCCPQEFELDYNPETGVLIVDYRLPSLDDIPKVKEIRYNKTKDEFSFVQYKEAEINRNYDNLIYQITLRTLHELFEADTVNAISSIAFNGFVHSTDPTTGKDVSPCIVSVHTKRESFLEINLAKVVPKACFKSLKGVGSSKLSALSPVPPIIEMTKDDKRFVTAYNVIEYLESSTNIAAMDWEDFEHLIREVFEQEFTQSGGEVKVTQASRDGGVDAIAFDPDPIRGGKIVIQAKRYTNTVGVSAVRDLYGTFMNEGATKGILVTTSDYGPDAYEFAKGKPITLLNGNNLLYLLEKHGHSATIDIQAAKLVERQKNP